MDNSYYIGRLDELSELLREIYYDLDDAIKLRTTTPSFQKYRDELESKTTFLLFLKKDFPEHSSLVDTARADIKDMRDKLANDKTFSLAASAVFDAGQSVQALTMVLINTKAEQGDKASGGVIVAIIVAIILVMGFEGCIYFLKWKWLLNHPNRLSLEIGTDVMLILASLALFVPKRHKMYWFSGVCAVALVLLSLLGK